MDNYDEEYLDLKNYDIISIIKKYIYKIYDSEYCKIIFFAGTIDEPTKIYKISISELYFLEINAVEVVGRLSPAINIWISLNIKLLKNKRNILWQ